MLVHAAAGGVGGFAVQMAKAANAFVIGTCSASNAKYVGELGADEVIDYRSEDVFQRAKAIAGERGIDAIVDNIGPSNGVNNLGLLGPEGGLACIAGIPDLSVVPDLPCSISIHDIGLGGVMASAAFRRRQEDLARMATEVMALVQVGKIRATVTEQITLEAIPKALVSQRQGHCQYFKVRPESRLEAKGQKSSTSVRVRLKERKRLFEARGKEPLILAGSLLLTPKSFPNRTRTLARTRREICQFGAIY